LAFAADCPSHCRIESILLLLLLLRLSWPQPTTQLTRFTQQAMLLLLLVGCPHAANPVLLLLLSWSRPWVPLLLLLLRCPTSRHSALLLLLLLVCPKRSCCRAAAA
jgi:hypothetical protein